MAVTFHFEAVRAPLKNRTRLKAFIEQIFSDEGLQAEYISYVFCADFFLHSLNNTYLNHDTYTDILTFDLSGKKGIVIAEIYISIDRVRENATIFKIPFEKEFHRVIFHGILHLCGYNDHTEIEKKMMRKKEDEYLARYFHEHF